MVGSEGAAGWTAGTARVERGHVTGSLTGAVVRVPERLHGGWAMTRPADLGLSLVLDGSVPWASEVIDLGSGIVRTVDLSRRLVILGWFPDVAWDRLREARGGAVEEREDAAFRVAVQLLRTSGFDPLLRPVFLRLGFRDVCRDLDPHEEQSVRVRLSDGRPLRLALDCESVAIVARTTRGASLDAMESLLRSAFPSGTGRLHPSPRSVGAMIYRVALPTPASLEEVQEVVDEVRNGTMAVLREREPDRADALGELLRTFGRRNTLRLVAATAPPPSPSYLRSGAASRPAGPTSAPDGFTSRRVH